MPKTHKTAEEVCRENRDARDRRLYTTGQGETWQDCIKVTVRVQDHGSRKWQPAVVKDRGHTMLICSLLDRSEGGLTQHNRYILRNSSGEQQNTEETQHVQLNVHRSGINRASGSNKWRAQNSRAGKQTVITTDPPCTRSGRIIKCEDLQKSRKREKKAQTK